METNAVSIVLEIEKFTWFLFCSIFAKQDSSIFLLKSSRWGCSHRLSRSLSSHGLWRCCSEVSLLYWITYLSQGLSGNSGDLGFTDNIRPSHQLPPSSYSFLHQTWHLSLGVQFLVIAAMYRDLSTMKSGKSISSGSVNLKVSPHMLEEGSINSRLSLQQLSPDPGSVE